MAAAESRRPPPSAADAEPILPAAPFQSCPIRLSLGALGRKWTLLVLRDITFLPGSTFGSIRKSNPGLGNRILSLRLKQLLGEGLIERREPGGAGSSSGYFLTERGRAVVPVLTALIQYGSRYHAEEVFSDHRPRALEEVYPEPREYLAGDFTRYLRRTAAPGRAAPTSPSSRARYRRGS